MIIRLLVPDEHSSVPLGEKFGAPPSLHRIRQLTELAMQLQLPIIGVSFHCGSGCHDPEAYAQAIRLAKNAMDMIDSVQLNATTTNDTIAAPPKCWLLDIGGGYPGRDGWKENVGRFAGTSSPPSVEEETDESLETAAKIAHAINPLLDELFPSTNDPDRVQIISEPGRYFVEEAFGLCS